LKGALLRRNYKKAGESLFSFFFHLLSYFLTFTANNDTLKAASNMMDFKQYVMAISEKFFPLDQHTTSNAEEDSRSLLD